MNSLVSKYRLLLVASALSPFCAAQEKAPTAAATADDAAIELSPFVVKTSKDEGYRVTNSLGGTKMDTAVKDLPFSDDVITNEFIKDIAAHSVIEALGYSAGVNLAGNSEWESRISIRGMPSGVLRDGLMSFITPDWTMVDRVEVIRGASAIVYGQTQPGGVVNVVTKQPSVEKMFGSVEQTVGQWNSYTTQFDFNVPTADHKFAVRLVGSYVNEDGHRDDYHKEGSVIFPSFTWRPSKRTSVTIELARDKHKTTGINAGLPANYANSTPGFNYLNQNYANFYAGLTAAQKAAYPDPSKLKTAQVGGPAPIFRGDPYTFNIGGKTGYWDAERRDYIVNFKQVLFEGGTRGLIRSDLQINASRIDDRVQAAIPLIDGVAPQGVRGDTGAYDYYDADLRDANPANWSGAIWALGSDYSGTVNRGAQAGYYYDHNEKNPGAKNMIGSSFYYTPDLTTPGASSYIPLAGANTYEWTPMVYRLRLVDDRITADDVSTFKFGDHTDLRLLIGVEHGRQRYWDYGRKGQLSASTGSTEADLAQNYIRSSSGWSSTAWGPASGNGHFDLPEWGYAFADFGASNPGTLTGAGADRKYRGWYLYNADTGERRDAQITVDQVRAVADQYYYGLVQDVGYTSFYSTGQLDLLDKKVSLLGAVRYSHVKKKDYRVFGNVPNFPEVYNPVTPQFGVVYNITNDWNVYASYAENFYYQWSRPSNILSDPVPTITGNNFEIGSKFNLLEGRINGTVAVYETNFRHLTYTDYTFNRTAYNPTLYPQIGGVDQYGVDRFGAAVRTIGQELNLQYKANNAWDILVSYSHSVPKFKEGPAWMVGLQLPGTPEHMASVWNRYSFAKHDGWLKGLMIGGGAVYNSPTFVGSTFNNEGKIVASSYYWKTPVFIRFDAFVGYGFTAFQKKCYASLNVKNLADRVNWTTDEFLKPDGQGREFVGSLRVDF